MIPNEPVITINGVTLTDGQAMTVRVAVGHFYDDLSNSPLGTDEVGKSLTEGYLNRVREIFKLMGIE